MDILHFDLTRNDGKFKEMNAVNNGPVHKRHATDQWRSNLEPFKAARIPYARNHDAAFFASYGGEHGVDITAVFPDFNADPYLPESYDFACTDEYVGVTLDAGTKTFYRLGQKIEHYIKKFGTLPPSDFNKWAVICEHIISHYTEGWADGFEYDMPYWEIWNEPDLDPDDSKNKRTWGGTKAQFFDLYEITAKHLKTCFPHLKIGGPALSGKVDWAEEFLCEMQKRGVPIDFFSWHVYCTTTEKMIKRAESIRELLDKYGYKNAESILNEWNYVRGWREDFIYSIQTIIGIKGAAFTLACMAAAQHSSIDMLMYYDARPCAFNGLFDFYTYYPLKGYYPFLWYGNFYDCEREILCDTEIEDLYTLCGVDKNGKVTAYAVYYTDDDECTQVKTVKFDFGKDADFDVYLLDKDHTNEKITDDLEITLTPNSAVFIKEK